MVENCVFCLIAEGKIQTVKLYEDDQILAFLDIRPVSKGHVQVISKAHSPLIINLEKEVINKLFNTSLQIGKNLVKKLKATGINYLINEGSGAGQRVAHSAIQIIPRYDGDGINFTLPEKELNQEQVMAYIKEITDILKSPDSTQETTQITKNEVITPTQNTPVNTEKIPEKDIPIPEIHERIPKYW